MKVRNFTLFLALVLAAWLPSLAQQSATPSQEPTKPTVTEPAKQDPGTCKDCCKHHQDAGKEAEHHMADCCAAKDGKTMECCQAKDGTQAACCSKDKDSKSAMNCCKGHNAAGKDGKHECSSCSGKDGKSCCGNDAMACNSKDKKNCCSDAQCAAHANGR